jgi:SNW domain-containing protein 1
MEEEASSSDDEEVRLFQQAPSHPKYGERKNWAPTGEKDFGDGGAFPEVHILQYPCGMGRKDKSTAVVPLSVDSEGKIKFGDIVKRGHKIGKVIHTTLDDMKPKNITEGLEKPSEEEIQKTAEKTRKALGILVERSIAAAQPTHVKKSNKEPTFIRYTPNQQGDAYNSGAKQRLIRLQEMPVDPFEPPKFKHKKLPNGPPSPPAPVMHSPPRKITAADQQNWKIPPCISHWKNIKGYTIPLHHRLAADGRDMQAVKINPKFEQLTESLLIAERTARKEIKERAHMTRALERQKKEEKEQLLFKMAQQARAGAARALDEEREEDDYEDAVETEKDVEGRQQRAEMRRDRQRDIRRTMRQEQRKAEKREEQGRGRDEDRDVSERIALGQKVTKSRDAMYDSRLFNHASDTSAGGVGDIYSKPLFNAGSQGIYRPKQVDAEQYGDEVESLLEKSTAKFKPNRGFDGADSGGPARDKPVQFEADPFGLGDAFSDTRNSGAALDGIGKGSRMGVVAGGSRLDRDAASSSSGRRQRMEFSESSSTRDSRGDKRRRHD